MPKLFVGGIPFRMSENELRATFAAAGIVTSVFIPLDHETKKPRGFAFVEMADQAGAEEAIARYDGKSLGGRQIVVHPSRPYKEITPA